MRLARIEMVERQARTFDFAISTPKASQQPQIAAHVDVGCGEADDPASGVDREVVGRNAFVLDFWIVGNLGVKPDDVPKLANGNAEPGTRFAAAPWTTSE